MTGTFHRLGLLSRLLLLLAFGLNACSKPSQPPTASTWALRVKVSRAWRTDIVRKIDLVTILRPYQEAALHARVEGYLQSVFVDRGSVVKKGELLAVIEVPSLRRSFQSQKAQILAHEALLAHAEAEYQHRNVLSQRLQELWKASPGATSRLRVDDALGLASIAKARIQTARADLLVSKEKLAQIQTEIAFSQIRAPFDGVITERNVHPGALIRIQGTPSPLFHLVSQGRLRGVLDIPAPDAPFVRLGLPLTLFLDALPHAPPFHTKLQRSSGSLHPFSRTLRVEFDVDNPQNTLTPEMYGRVSVEIEPRAKILVVPLEWIFLQKQQRSVFLFQKGSLRQIKIQTGIEATQAGQTLTEIVSGLQGDEEIVTHPDSSMADGLSATLR